MKKLAILSLVAISVLTSPAYANKSIELSDFNKLKKDRQGDVLMSNFLNKKINGLNIDNCLIHLEKKDDIVTKDMMEYFNLCNDKNSKWLAKQVENSKPNFAKNFVAVEIKIPNSMGYLDYTYVIVNKNTKQVFSDYGINFPVKHPKYAPKFKFNVNSNKACTPPSKQEVAYIRIPFHDDMTSNLTFGGNFCLIWNGKRFHSRDYEDYLQSDDEQGL